MKDEVKANVHWLVTHTTLCPYSTIGISQKSHNRHTPYQEMKNQPPTHQTKDVDDLGAISTKLSKSICLSSSICLPPWAKPHTDRELQ